MTLKHLLVGAIFVVGTIVGASAGAASFRPIFVDSSFRSSPAITLAGAEAVTGTTGLLAGPNGAATAGIEALRRFNRIETKLPRATGNGGADNRSVTSTAGVTLPGWENRLHPDRTNDYLSSFNSDSDRFDLVDDGTISAAVVSEPATWGMMLFGVCLMAAGLRTMRVKRSAAKTNQGHYMF